MKIVFMGTPEFAVPTLKSLIASGHEVAAVVTQPDKPRGRGKNMQLTPVKEEALKNGITVYQPIRVREQEFINTLQEIKPDVIIVVAFGQILPETILNLPYYGCLNVHASLLPKYRGAAPIQWAVINGETESGVTAMFMEKGLDTGDMLKKVRVELDEKETGDSLHDKLSLLGGPLILEVLEELKIGTAVRIRQEDDKSTYAKQLDKKMGRIDWTKPAREIERLIRGLNSWPSAYTDLDGRTLKIWAADVLDKTPGKAPGSIVGITRDSIEVSTGEGVLAVREVQLEGKKRMETNAFLRGYPLTEDMLLI